MGRASKTTVLVDIGLIILLAVVGYGFICRRGEIPYSPHSDIVAEHLGTKTVLYRAWTEYRTMPFWRADQFSGYTGLTNPQSLYTFPLHFLFYLMPPADAMGWTIWLHFVMAALGFYLVGVVLEMGRGARLMMAVAALFSLKLVMAAYAGWLPIIPGIVSFPFIFAAFFYMVKRPGLGATLSVAAATTLCLHTGHVQFFYYAALFSVAYLVVRIVDWWRRGRRRTVGRVVFSLLCGVALAVGCSAYLYIPLFAESFLVSRGEASYDFFLARHAVTPRHLLTFFYPEAIGTPLDGSYAGMELWEDVGYFGIVPLLFALLGIVWGWRRHPTRFLAVSFLVSVLLTMNTPLLRLLYAVVPGMHLFRCPSRLLFLSSFFAITLSGVGLDEAILRMRKRHGSSMAPLALVSVILLVIVLEGSFYARRYLSTAPQDKVIPESDYRGFLTSDTDLFRIAPLMRYPINYGWAAPMGLQMITGYDSFNFRHYQEYFDILQIGSPPRGGARVWTDLNSVARGDLLDALNVKYIVTAEPLAIPERRFREVGHWNNQPIFVFYRGMVRGPIYIYENENFKKRAFWVEEVISVEEESEVIDQMGRREITSTAVIISPERRRLQCIGSSDDLVELLGYHDGYLEIKTRNRKRRFLIISEIWHPGWRAFLDGKEIKLYQTDLALMGAWIPAGTHRLVLRFRPIHWRPALAISIFSGSIFSLLLVGLCVRSLRS